MEYQLHLEREATRIVFSLHARPSYQYSDRLGEKGEMSKARESKFCKKMRTREMEDRLHDWQFNYSFGIYIFHGLILDVGCWIDGLLL